MRCAGERGVPRLGASKGQHLAHQQIAPVSPMDVGNAAATDGFNISMYANGNNRP